MKKIIFFVSAIILLLTSISLWQAMFHFENVQYQPTGKLIPAKVEQSAAVERLSQAIQIQTVSNDDPKAFNPLPFTNFQQFLKDKFPETHANAELTIISNYSLVYKFEGSNPDLKPILLMGHMDVVPVDEITAKQWTHKPYSGTVADGMVWGRGAIDDKSTVMALMEAMELTLTNDIAFERSLYFSFGHDEEIGGKKGAAQIAKYFKKQDITFDFVLDEGGLIIEKGMMPGVDSQVAIIGIAEKGFVNIRLVVEQTGGHSSQPPENTGPGILAKAIVKLEENKFPTDLSFLSTTFDKVGYFADFKSRLALGNLWLFAPIVEKSLLSKGRTAASIRTTTATTMLSGSDKSNVLPSKSTAVVNFRIMPGQTYQSVAQYVEDVIDDPRVKLEVFMESNPSKVSSINNSGYQLLEQTIRELDDNILVAPYLVQAATDSKHFYQVSDNIYRFIMVKINNDLLKSIHGIDERIVIEDYIQGIQYFHEVIKKATLY